MRLSRICWACVVVAAGCAGDPGATPPSLGATGELAAGLRGAFFTTLADGSRVDAGGYGAKDGVYLDSGPRRPQDPALPEGQYVFQVTDPSGQTVLSADAVSCRGFHVDADGLISGVNDLPCAHPVSEDPARGGLTVRLMPYADTPNPGGEYKVWVTSAGAYAATGRFLPRDSKTDSFRI